MRRSPGPVLFVLVAGVAPLLLRPGLGILTLLPRRALNEVADASVWDVVVLDRNRYRATARIVYAVQARDGSSFYAIREARMNVSQLPRAGDRVTVRYDPRDHQRFEVLTTAGTETYGP